VFEEGVSIAEPARNSLGVLVTCCVCVRHTNHYATFKFGVVCCDCCREAYIKSPNSLAASIMVAALPAEVAKKRKVKLPKVSLKSKAIALILEGKGPQEISEILNCHHDTVIGYKRQWLAKEAKRINQSKVSLAQEKNAAVLYVMTNEGAPMRAVDIVRRINQDWCSRKTIYRILNRIGADRCEDGRYVVEE